MKSAAKRVPLHIELDAVAQIAETYSPEVAEFVREEVAHAASLSYPHTPRLLAIIQEGPIERTESGDPILNLSETFRLWQLSPTRSLKATKTTEPLQSAIPSDVTKEGI